MAILKHLNVHNANYQDAVTYLLFQHDEHARPIRNERGRMILRENVLIDALNTKICSYAVDCNATNRQWRKNNSAREVKSHHFILSFPKEDAEEHGLTPELAQQMGMDFARKHFSGHQCIVATHDDGSQHSGNIHVHICFNSVRAIEMPPPEYSDLERDCKPGFKFQCSDQCMNYLKRDVERMCREQGLSQIPLTKPAAKKVTNEEYWAQKRGERQLDGQPKFRTDLEQIRRAIDDVKSRAASVKEFKALLQREYRITIRDKRGRWSYVPEGRKNGVTPRRLGAAYSKEAVIAFLEKRQRQAEKPVQEQHDTPTEVEILKPETVSKPYEHNDSLLLYLFHRTYDLNQPPFKENIGLERWAKLQNLKETAQRFNFLMENRALNVEQLHEKLNVCQREISQVEAQRDKTERRLKDINRLLRLEGQAFSNQKVYREYSELKLPWKKKAFFKQHQKEIEAYKSAMDGVAAYREKHHIEGKLPGPNRLKAEKQALLQERVSINERLNHLQNTHTLLKAASEEVLDACQLNRLINSDEYFRLTGKKMSMRKRLALDQELQRRQPEQRQREQNWRRSRSSHELE